MEDHAKPKLDQFEQQLEAMNKRFDDMQWVIGAIIIFFGIVISASSGLAVYLFKDQSEAQEKLTAQLQSAVKEQNEKLTQDEKDIKQASQQVLDHASEDADRQTKFVSDYVSGTRADVNTWLDRGRQDSKKFEEEVNSKVSEGYGDPKLDLLGSDNRSLDGGILGASNGQAIDITGNTHHFVHFELRIRNSGTGPSGPVSLKFYSDDIPFTTLSDDVSAGRYSGYMLPDAVGINRATSGSGIPGGGFTYIDDFKLDVQDKLPPAHYHALVRTYYGPHRSAVIDTRAVLVIN